MAHIQLTKVAKHYQSRFLFKELDYQFTVGMCYGITGHNGSGKSTLLRIIAGQLSPSFGQVTYTDTDQSTIPNEDIYRHVSIVGPYMDMIMDFTLLENFRFAQSLAPFSCSIEELTEIAQLHPHRDRPLKDYSSGMLQRAKTTLAVLSNKSILLLDEPTTNLDEEGAAWFSSLIEKHRANKLVIIGSNVKSDFPQGTQFIHVPDYA